MPSYSWMPGGDLEELSSHVLDLAVTGLAEILEDDARQRGTRLPREVALQRARWWMEPGEPIGSPPEVEVTPAVLDRGRELFTSYCAACHGEDGKGRRAPRGWAPGSEVTWSRDLTRGLLRGEATRDEIYRRIRSGMPGSAMPPTRLDSPADQAALLAYVLDLLPTSGSDPFIQTRRTLIVSKALAGLPSSPGDTRWETAVTTLLPLMPLFSSEGSILEVEVACLHRGDEIAVRITWDDATCDDRSLGGSPFPDGVAMQLTGEMDPPLFGMGAMAHPVRIWHWKAFELRDEAGSLDLLGSSRSGATPDTPATCPVSSGGTTTNLVATGPGAMEKTTAATSAEAVFNDGQWSVVLRGSLVGDPGTPAGRFLAVAIWNGSAGESGVRKSVTTWHELSIGR
jgi:DMSO reductase family type II enzyme heme b subunit